MHTGDDLRVVQVLLVSANADFRHHLSDRLVSTHWQVSQVSSGAEALDHLYEHASVEILLLDPLLPDLLPAEFCGIVRQRFPHVEVIPMNTRTGKVQDGNQSAVNLTSELAELLLAEPAAAVLRPAPQTYTLPRDGAQQYRVPGMVGQSPAMQQTYSMIHKVAPRDTTVLITGESGTGKDLVAQGIHALSARHKAPFVVVNCAAIPEALLEAELFGYAKGAFTGAMQSRMGRIHAAQGGTLFLDEIGDMPLALQSKILRFLEQGEVQRLGSNDNFKVDVRVIAATNAGLADLVKQKLFREDLYYRLAVFPIRMAPLRDRQSDVRALAEFFLNRFAPGMKLCADAVELLCRHRWPGNVRELRNVMERAVIVSGHPGRITVQDILL
jgi:DNA-binding NtrC family response regulator